MQVGVKLLSLSPCEDLLDVIVELDSDTVVIRTMTVRDFIVYCHNRR